MELGIVGFILGVAIAYILMRFDYNQDLKKTNQIVQDLQKKILEIDSISKETSKLIASNIATVGANSLKVNNFVEQFEKACKVLEEEQKDTAAEINNIQVYCTKMKQAQIELQDILSKKRPVIKVPENINVTVTTKEETKIQQKKTGLGKGVDALIKK